MRQITAFANRLGIQSYLPLKLASDLLLWVIAGPLAFLVRFETRVPGFWLELLIYTAVSAFLKTILVFIYALHRQSWHKVGVRDLFMILRAVGAASIVLLAAAFVIYPALSIPRSIPILDGILSVFLLSGARLALRLLNEHQQSQSLAQPARRVLVVGAGEAGTMIAREMLRHPQSALYPVGYLDDERGKQRTSFYGVPVVGVIDDLPTCVKRLNVNEVLIAMPSAPGEVIRHVVTLAREAKIKHRIIPGVYDILSGNASISHLREVDVEDLLRREPVRLNMEEIASYLQDRVVLVTGAGGSIGSELVRQVMRFNPSRLILLERDENNLYMFERELCSTCPDLEFTPLVADIQRTAKLDHIFSTYHPQVVFHAAAHKHVPVMEANPDEAILNNVLGTRNLLQVALTHGSERFVNISTDKAIQPTSVMGASKRIAEYLVAQAAREANDHQAFVSVRFGNVLGSRGSAIPIFREQIQAGGPVTITHPDMKRFFMSIPEATQLVLQAAALGENGALYILDMGDPVNIVDLACEVIRLSGLEPYVDIQLEFVGVRPGEKLYEELLTTDEELAPTRYDKILRVQKDRHATEDNFDTAIARLLEAANALDSAAIRAVLKELIPSYNSNPHFS
nr:polysaccharide biosynthesis protein [Anaerolineae bacterium]